MALGELTSSGHDHDPPTAPTTSGIIDIDPRTDSRWDSLHHGAHAALFSSSTWLSILHSVYGFEFRARLKVVDDVAIAGFGYAELDGPRGARIVSLPFCDFNDPIIDAESSWVELTDGLIGGDRPLVIRTLDHPVVSADTRLDTSTVGTAHQLDASTDPNEVFNDFATLPKRMIRRAAKVGLRTGTSTSRETLRSFFDLHLHVRKYRHGLLAQPYELFEQIATTYFDEGKGFIAGSWAGDVFAGGCVVLIEGDTAYYKFSASHPDHRRDGVSHVTLFEGLRETYDRGLRWYDLGRSDLDPPGLVDFKRRFRPLERSVTTHTSFASGSKPVNGPALSETLGELTQLFVRPDVPDEVTERAGRLLYGFFA